ncbi:MAG: hypothetical protein EZS28_034643, partial [Streblomastix strix]
MYRSTPPAIRYPTPQLLLPPDESLTQDLLMYIISYSILEVMQTQTIILTNDGAHYIRAPLAARGTATCSMVQTCQIIWQIQIPANTLAIQFSGVKANGAVGVWDTHQTIKMQSGADADTQQPYNEDERIKFQLSFSTVCGPFNQFPICKDSQKLWETSIYARELAIIASNSLIDQCSSNSVIVSPLESIWSNGSELTEPYLQQFSCIDQKLSVIAYIIVDIRLPIRFESTYTMIPLEKPDIIYLKNRVAAVAYDKYAIRLVNME